MEQHTHIVIVVVLSMVEVVQDSPDCFHFGVLDLKNIVSELGSDVTELTQTSTDAFRESL